MAYFKEVLPNSHGKRRPHVDVKWCKSHDVSKVSISKTGFRRDLSPTKRGLPVPWKGHSKDLVDHDGKALTQRPDQNKIAAEILKKRYNMVVDALTDRIWQATKQAASSNPHVILVGICKRNDPGTHLLHFYFCTSCWLQHFYPLKCLHTTMTIISKILPGRK